MKLPVLFAVALGALPITAQASEATSRSDQYLCVPDKKIGFEYYDNQLDVYGATTLQAGKNFTISTLFPHDIPLKFFIIETGTSRPSGYCKYGFNDWGILFCDLGPAEFKFNKYNGRFITVFTGGYDDYPRGAYMEIGKCSSLGVP